MKANGRTGRRGWVIAIDGPAGSGKSTVGTLIAKRLGYRFINTGEMYRALTWKALDEGIDPADPRAVVALANRLRWQFKTNGEGVIIRTFIDGKGVTQRIREERVSRNSSAVAGVPAVRRLMRSMQRRLGRGGRIVMEGRDISTNVFPDAEFKVYLDASPGERALRRTKQLRTQGKKASLKKVMQDMIARDRKDLKRKINPLRQAEDAVVIDTTRLTLRQVADRILGLIRARRRRRSAA